MSRLIYFIVILICGVLLFQYCVEPFTPESQEFENALVVDGFISNEQKSHEIILSRTYPIDTTEFIPESGASVWVEDDNGNKITFSEQNPGHYLSPSTFQGQIGTTYQLFITTKNEKSYKSTPVIMKDTPPIDSLYSRYISSSEVEDVSGVEESGVQVYLDTHDPTGNTQFYRWEWKCTYEIRVPYPSTLVYDPETHEVNPRGEDVSRCWSEDSSSNILIKSTGNLSNDRVARFPLNFTSEKVQKMRTKYSVLAKQYALSPEGFFFWDNLRKINETQGGLSDIQPGILEGNIQSVDDENEVVLGYFDAAKVVTKRIFVDPDDFRDEGLRPPPYFYDCETIKLQGDEFYEFMDEVYGFYEYLYFDINPMDGGHVIAYYLCSNCSKFSNNKMPDFWED